MTALDDIFGPLTASLLGQFGKPVTYQRKSTGRLDTATMKTNPGPRQLPLEISAIVEDGEGAAAKKISIAGRSLPFRPGDGDTIKLPDGRSYRVQEPIGEVFSGAEVALYELHCSRETPNTAG